MRVQTSVVKTEEYSRKRKPKNWTLILKRVPETGFEPAHLAVRDPKSRASANSATRAIRLGIERRGFPLRRARGARPKAASNSAGPESHDGAALRGSHCRNRRPHERRHGFRAAAKSHRTANAQRSPILAYVSMWLALCSRRSASNTIRSRWRSVITHEPPNLNSPFSSPFLTFVPAG